MKLKFQLIKSKGQWYWRIVASNGRVLCHSEKYKTKRAAENIVKRVRLGLIFKTPLEYKDANG